MIKKILLSLGFIGLGLINFSFGYLEFNTNEGFTLNGNTFVIDEKLNFLDSKYVGYSNSCGYGNLPNLFFRTDEGLAFYNSTNPAGLLIYSGYCLVPQYNSGYYDNNLSNCNEILPIENLFDQNLTFKKIVFNGINQYNGCMVWTQDGFSSNIAFIDIDGNAYIFPRAGGVFSNYSEWGYSLINTNDNRENIINEYANELSPFNGGGSSNIPISGTGQYVELTGNLVYSDEKCTYGEIVNYLQEAGYNKYLCYGGLDNFDTFDSTLNYSPVPGTGLTLGQILTNASHTWDSPFEWFAFWNGLYQDKDNYISMWESYPAVYRTWFDLYYQYGGPDLFFESVNEYCIMISLVSDYTHFYNGTYFQSACQNYIIPSRSKTGDNAVSLNWGGIFGSGDSTELQNGKTFISEFFTQIKNNITIPDRSDFGLGILPSYIIIALLGLILFRFLSH